MGVMLILSTGVDPVQPAGSGRILVRRWLHEFGVDWEQTKMRLGIINQRATLDQFL